MSSGRISLIFAPKEFIFTKPLIPNVEGIHHEMTFQKPGSAFVGHDIPDSNKNGIEVNTIKSIILSLSFTNLDINIEKNVTDKR